MFLHYLQWKLDATILYSLFEWNGYVTNDLAYLQLRKDSQKRDFSSEKSLTQPWCAMQQSYDALCSNHTQTNYAPFSLSASIRFHLSLWAGVDIRGGELETAISCPPFSEIPRVHFESFALSFCLDFSSHRPDIFWNHQTY